MSFLPIVERELRVAARRRSTFWLRVVAVLVAVVIWSGFMIVNSVGGTNTASLGGALFSTLTWLVLAAVLSAGLFFASDCLSEEKREGTLGLLFLTDLRGYDVVLGKLLATSLRGLLALLAVFPILSVTLLMGGVTGGQFWRTVLGLINALLCSLAAGLLVSALSRESQKAMSGTLLFLLLLTAGGPSADSLLGLLQHRAAPCLFSLSSPIYVFARAGDWSTTPYWGGLAVSQALAWLLLALACAVLPRAWQEKGSKVTASGASRAFAWKYGGERHRGALRRKLLGQNPVLWLASRARWQGLGIWVMAVGGVGAFAALFVRSQPMQGWVAWSFVDQLVRLLLYLGAAAEAGHFFVEARRSGLLELLLAAPLSVRQIVDGQWRALLRRFALPVVVLLLLQVGGVSLSQRVFWGGAAVQVPLGAAGLAAALGSAAATALITAANLLALVWFGMWMGLTSKNNNLAALKTIVFVQVIPLFVLSFASGLAMSLFLLPLFRTGFSGPPSSVMLWFPLVGAAVAFVLYVGKDIGFIVWARQRLYGSFRERAAQSFNPVRLASPPALPPPIPTPPVIAAPS